MKIQFYKNTKYVSLEIDYYFEFNKVTYKIPQGFLFDAGSIPRVLWGILGHPFYYKYIKQYLEHDFLYSNYFHKHYFKPNRNSVDNKFRKDIGGIKGWVMYLGVRLGGWVKYGRPLEINKEDLEKIF